MTIMCYASDVTDYYRRMSELSNTPLHIKYYTTIIEKYPAKPKYINLPVPSSCALLGELRLRSPPSFSGCF